MSEWNWQTAENEILELLERLVNIDSGTFDKPGVDAVGAVLTQQYEALGFKVEKEEQAERGDNLLITHQDAVDPDILIVAHMDTVFPKGTVENRPFSKDEERAYGPGVVDMKGSQATTLYALKYLLQSGSDAVRRVRIVLNTDEEIGSVHSRRLIEQQARLSRYALIVEPSDNEGTLVTGRRGGGKYDLHIHGVAAHSGAEPEKGRSAIADLAHKIVKLHALTDAPSGVHVNVGIIEGGTSGNTIAPHAFAKIDLRMETAEQAIEYDRRIREITAAVDVEGTRSELIGGITRPPTIQTEGSDRLLAIVIEEAAKLGETITGKNVGSGSDGNLTSALGIPTIDGLGPRGGNAHSADEYLVIDTLVPRTKLLAALIERLAAE